MEIPQWLKRAGEFISPARSEAMIAQFMKAADKGRIDSVYFSRDNIDKLLAQDGCVGVRVYFARDEYTSANTVILKAVNEKGETMNEKILEVGAPCPPYC